MSVRLSRRDLIRAASVLGGLAVIEACAPTGVPGTVASAPAAGTATPTPKPVAVKAAWVAMTSNQMIWPVAKEAGYFSKYGVDFDLSYINGSTTAVAAMLGNDISMMTAAGSAVVTAQAAGTDLVMIAGFVNTALFRVVAAPGITSIDQLKGKTVAVTRIGNADYFAWQTIAAKQGWKTTDLNYVAGNDEPGKLTLLKSGNAQAIAVSPPNNINAVQQGGGKEILDTGTYKEPEQQVGIVATRKYLTENRAAALGVVKASIEGIARWKKDKAFVQQVTKQYLKNDDPLYLDVGHSAYTNAFAQAPYPSEAGLARVIEQVASGNPKAKDLKPAQMIDRSFVQELETSGFIKQIYGG